MLILNRVGWVGLGWVGLVGWVGGLVGWLFCFVVCGYILDEN